MRTDKQLKSLAVRGVGWLALKRIFTQILLTGANLVLVRILFPEDFGTFAIIQTLIILPWVFADLGLGRALVQRKRDPNKKLLRSVWWTQVGLGFFVAVILWTVGPLLISYYAGSLSSSSLSWLRLLVISQIFANMSLVSTSLLERRLAYGRVLVGEISGLLVTQASIILLAVSGLGVASFVYGVFIGKLATLVLFFILSPWPWGFNWDWGKLKPLLSFGVPFQMAGWVGILNGAVVPIFIGRFPGPGGWSGPQAVGFVSWAGGVAALAVFASNIVEQILFPLMSRIRDNLAFSSRIFKRFLGAVVVVSFGASMLVMGLAEEITRFIYTPDWLPALPALRLSIIQINIIAVNSLTLSALFAFGETRLYRNLHILWAVLQWALTVPLVLYFGFWGVNLAGILVSATGVISYIRIKKYLEVNYVEIIKKPLIISVFSLSFVWIIRGFYPVENLIDLVMLSIVGGIFYLGLLHIFMRRELRGILMTAKSLPLSLASGFRRKRRTAS